MYTFKFTQTENNKVRLTKEFSSKKEANKVLRELIKSGRIEKRGYDYFTTSRNLEVVLNY